MKAPQMVIDQLEIVRQTGETNMASRLSMMAVASKMECYALWVWLEDHKHDYHKAIAEGLEPE